MLALIKSLSADETGREAHQDMDWSWDNLPGNEKVELSVENHNHHNHLSKRYLDEIG